MINAGTTAAQGGTGGGAFDIVAADTWNNFVLEAVNAAPEILRNAFEVLRTQANRNRFAIFVGFMTAMGITAADSVANAAPAKLKFAGGKVGNGNGATKTVASKTNASSTSSTCNPSQTVDQRSPICIHEKCKGEGEEGKRRLCTKVSGTTVVKSTG